MTGLSGNETTWRQIRNILAFFAIVLFLALMKLMASIIIPFVIAIFVFLIVNPVLLRLDKLKVPKIISMLLTMLLVGCVLVGLVYIFFVIVDMLVQPDGLPAYVARVQALDRSLSEMIAPYIDEDPMTFSILSWLNVDWYSIAMASLTSISGKFISIMSDVLLVLLYLLFMIMERQTILPKLMAALPRGKVQRMTQLLSRMNRQISRYLMIKIIISVITGICFYLISVMTGLDFPLIWGVLAVVLNFIPTIGSIICTGGAILMGTIQFAPDWSRIVLIAVLFIGTETVLGNIIDPRMQGVQLNISPLLILASLALWGYIWGAAGMFLSVPLTSIVQIVCANIPSLRPVAIILSEGRYYKRNQDRKHRGEDTGDDADNFEMPDNPSGIIHVDADDEGE